MMPSKRNLRSYFAKHDNAKAKASYLIESASNITGETETQPV